MLESDLLSALLPLQISGCAKRPFVPTGSSGMEEGLLAADLQPLHSPLLSLPAGTVGSVPSLWWPVLITK